MAIGKRSRKSKSAVPEIPQAKIQNDPEGLDAASIKPPPSSPAAHPLTDLPEAFWKSAAKFQRMR